MNTINMLPKNTYHLIPLIGIFILAIGFLLTLAGLSLIHAHGSYFFLLVGSCLLISSVFLIMANPIGFWLFALTFAISIIITYVEVGFVLHGLSLRIILNVFLFIVLFILFYHYPCMVSEQNNRVKFKVYYAVAAIMTIFIMLITINLLMLFFHIDTDFRVASANLLSFHFK